MAVSNELLMNEIQKVGFATYDMQLYLDTHPTDRKALEQYNKYATQLKMLKEKYSRNYGPIELLSPTQKYPFVWVLPPWPWMKMNLLEEEDE